MTQACCSPYTPHYSPWNQFYGSNSGAFNPNNNNNIYNNNYFHQPHPTQYFNPAGGTAPGFCNGTPHNFQPPQTNHPFGMPNHFGQCNPWTCWS